ncbi:hypothetical protein L3Q82_006906 [Scortum barcoo]|uniref:Uncharacterized protein n=1 Tax=Scortum barcoo TaxID=214431 RepID=A0ACB8WXK0_9TELE|nr:hypothetical protein L3Q82_006906 [Scortum barcoo]
MRQLIASGGLMESGQSVIPAPNYRFCYQAVDCQWGPYGEWSECDPCTKLQTRSRPMTVYAQFGGNLCAGEPTETRQCVTTKGCPLEEGCGDRFRCRSGKCISKSLLCNGDQDCEEDALDEGEVCGVKKYIVCHVTAPPPSTELLGLGFDVVTEKWRASVINTKSFGGQCRTIFSGAHSTVYRLPLSTIQYNFLANQLGGTWQTSPLMVKLHKTKVQNDFSSEAYSSSWKYVKDNIRKGTVSGTTTGSSHYAHQETITWLKNSQLLVLKNNIEVAQFQSNAPQYLQISEEFWKALAKLPSVYDYAAYRKVLERFGTHYLSEGSLGGELEIMVKFDMESRSRFVKASVIMNVKRFRDGFFSSPSPMRLAAVINGATYQSMEVPCAGLKKLYLRRATEQYISETDPCHCRPCSNNGLAVMDGNECKCICKPNTSGPACEVGTEVEGQPGVIHGRWTCWSAWSSCSGSRRSRSRSCSNPAPQNGGQHCIGESTETSECEDQELEHLNPSLELCAMSPTSQKSSLLNVCKMHVLQCMGKGHLIAEDSTCKWPERTTTGCTSCRMWETCDDQTNECRCKDSADCSTPGLNVCVRVGEDVAAVSQTMSECEAGLQRCKGENVVVVSILPCDA